MGHARRLLVERWTDSKKKIDRCIDSAIRLSEAMELGERNGVLSHTQKEGLLDDMKFVSKVFFDSIHGLSGKEETDAIGWFMYAIDNSNFIADSSWC